MHVTTFLNNQIIIAETQILGALPLSLVILAKDVNNLSVALSLTSCKGSERISISNFKVTKVRQLNQIVSIQFIKILFSGKLYISHVLTFNI